MGKAEKKDGAALIAIERKRQISGEGYDATHDDEHTSGELALAAALYATPIKLFEQRTYSNTVCFQDPWPWENAYDRRPHKGTLFFTPCRKQENTLKAKPKPRIAKKPASRTRNCYAGPWKPERKVIYRGFDFGSIYPEMKKLRTGVKGYAMNLHNAFREWFFIPAGGRIATDGFFVTDDEIRSA